MSVGRSVRKVYSGKTADWTRVPFGVVNGVGRGLGVLDGGVNRRGKGQFWGIKVGRPIVTDDDFVA